MKKKLYIGMMLNRKKKNLLSYNLNKNTASTRKLKINWIIQPLKSLKTVTSLYPLFKVVLKDS